MNDLPVVDCRGMLCPMPILHIRLKLNELSPGDEVLAWCTDPTFERDIAVFCNLSSVTLLETVKLDTHTAYRFKVQDISHL